MACIFYTHSQTYKVYFNTCYIDITIVAFLRKESTIIRNNNKKSFGFTNKFSIGAKTEKAKNTENDDLTLVRRLIFFND